MSLLTNQLASMSLAPSALCKSALRSDASDGQAWRWLNPCRDTACPALLLAAGGANTTGAEPARSRSAATVGGAKSTFDGLAFERPSCDAKPGSGWRLPGPRILDRRRSLLWRCVMGPQDEVDLAPDELPRGIQQRTPQVPVSTKPQMLPPPTPVPRLSVAVRRSWAAAGGPSLLGERLPTRSRLKPEV